MNPTTTHTPGAHRLTEAEIEIAFNYCDVHGTGLVTTAGLTARLGPLLLNNKNKGAAALDCSALLGGKPTLTLPELKAALLAPNATKGGGHHTRTPTPVPVPTTATAAALAMAGKGKGDAVAEAFGLMADRTGHIGREALAQWLRAVDFVAATERDLDILVQAADADGDGRISLDDFRTLVIRNRLLAVESARPAGEAAITEEEENEEGI